MPQMKNYRCTECGKKCDGTYSGMLSEGAFYMGRETQNTQQTRAFMCSKFCQQSVARMSMRQNLELLEEELGTIMGVYEGVLRGHLEFDFNLLVLLKAVKSLHKFMTAYVNETHGGYQLCEMYWKCKQLIGDVIEEVHHEDNILSKCCSFNLLCDTIYNIIQRQ